MTQIIIEIPQNATMGDLTTAKGAIFDASTSFVDWEKLHDNETGAISAPGRILMAIANELREPSSEVSIPGYVAAVAGSDHAESAHDTLSKAGNRAMNSGRPVLVIITPARRS